MDESDQSSGSAPVSIIRNDSAHGDVEAEIYRIIYEHPAISAKCVEMPPQFFTLPYIERLKGYIDIMEQDQGISQFTGDLRLRFQFTNKDRRKKNDPTFLKST